MRKRIVRLAALLALLVLLPALALADSFAVVRGGQLNLREAPSASAKSLGRYSTGTWMRVLGDTGYGWYAVTTMNGKSGYVDGRYLDFGSSANGGTVRYANGGYVNLRSGPSLESSVVVRVTSGLQVSILNDSYEWYLISVYQNGATYTGYMHASFIDRSATTSTVTTRNGGKVNVRSGPSSNHSSVGVLPSGTRVTVLLKGNGWYYVTGGGLTGFMSTSYLSGTGTTVGSNTGSSGSSGGTTSSQTAYVNNPRSTQVLNLREYPSQDARSIGQYRNGTQVKVVSYGATWCEVYVGTKHGYMMTSYLSFSYVPPASGGGTSGGTPTQQYAYVTNPRSTQVLNLREYPSQDARSLGQYRNGTRVYVVTYGATWCEVYVGDKHGYMMTAYLNFNYAPLAADGTSGVGVAPMPTSTPVPLITAFPTSTPVPPASYPAATPAAGTPITLVSGSGTVSVYGDSSLAQFKATVVDGTSAQMLSYGDSVCMVLMDGGVLYVATPYVRY